MEELHVQPKKSLIWPWILVLLIIIAAVWYFVTANGEDTVAMADNDSTAITRTATVGSGNTNDWDDVNFTSAVLVFGEITDDNVSVRGDSTYGIYSAGEDVFFNTDESAIRPEAESTLKEIVSSINQRYENGPIRIYGYTDARGSEGYNMELAEARVESVKNWLTSNGIEASRISKNAIGEVQPLPEGTTAQERQKNRRVEIVAKINDN